MKSVISIYIDSEVNSLATNLRINKSAICNEALRLATLKAEPNGEQSIQTALGNFLKNKVELEQDAIVLRRGWKKVMLFPHKKNQEYFSKLFKVFCEKHALSDMEAKAIAQKESTPIPPKEKP